MHRAVILLLACFALTPLSALALESDRDQSALIEADEVELDFGSGKRIYRGNVSVRQGTIRILADEIELFYRGEQLDHAVAKGNPAVFRQRPEGKDHDIIGTGQTIELDEVHNIVTFITDAQLRQGRDSIEGQRIVYDMAQDRMKVRGGVAAPTRTTRAGEDASTVIAQGDSGRPRLVIQPDAKNTSNRATAPPITTAKVETANTPAMRYIGNKGATVFAQRSVTAPQLGTLAANTPVRVLRSGDGWAQISAPRGIKVWIYGKFVSSSAGVGVVTGSRVRLRSAPSTGTGSTVTGEANRGQKVWVITMRGDWKQIEPPANFRAWIPSARIHKPGKTEQWQDDWRKLARPGTTD
jgi:lipopolysaccharide export system protein LptA